LAARSCSANSPGRPPNVRQAYLVNPHDLEGVKDAIEAALNQPAEEGRRRMRALRRQVLTHDVDRWARSFSTHSPMRIQATLSSVRGHCELGKEVHDLNLRRGLATGAASSRPSQSELR